MTPNKEISAAQAAVLDALQKNSGRPQEPAALQEAAANLFVILRPELAQRDLRNDPGFVQAQAAAAASFFNPGALHAKRMQDPIYRENYNAALQSLQRQAREAELAIPPSATDARQIEALRNDPKWRQEREESLRAAMQVKPNP